MKAGFALITGASGFLGRQLCSELIGAGWRVRATYVTAVPTTLENRSQLEWRRTESIGSTSDWTQLLDGGITAVVHLAAVAHRGATGKGVADSTYDEVNHRGAARLAAQAATFPSIQRFIFVSSIGAVASLSEDRIDESTPCRPDTPYGRSKLEAEKSIKRILAQSKLEWCILRPPLLYGFGNPGNMKRLTSLIKTRLPLPFASIHNRRTFLFVGNLADAIKLALTHPSARNQLFCVGDSEDLSTPELMRGLSSAAGCRVRMFPFPVAMLRLLGQFGNLYSWMFAKTAGFDSAMIEKLCGSLSIDSSRFRVECGWRPPFSLHQALQETVGNKRL